MSASFRIIAKIDIKHLSYQRINFEGCEKLDAKNALNYFQKN